MSALPDLRFLPRRPNRPGITRAAASSLALVLVLGACSSSGGDAGGGDSDAGGDGNQTEAGDGPQSFEDLDYRSPIGEFLGVEDVDYSSEESQAETLEREQRVQEAIAACMINQGFEYIPQDTSQFISFGDESPDGLQQGSREWTEKYGFGVSTQRWDQSQLGPDLVGYDSSQFGGSDGFTDPNEEYRNSLSEDEQRAWEEALYGEQPDIDFENLTEEEINAAFDEFYAEYEPTGCQEVAGRDIYEETDEGEQARFYEEFSDELDALYQSIEEHPDLVAHREKVSACVVEAGFDPISGGEDAYQYFEEKLTGIGPDYETDPLEDAGLDRDQMSDEELQEFYEAAYAFDPADSDALAEVQKLEIDTAIAAWDCGGGELNQYVVYNDIRIALEEQFLVDNAAAIAPYKAEG